MESVKAEAVAGEGKAVASERFSFGMKTAARLKAMKRQLLKQSPGSRQAMRTALRNAMFSTDACPW
jgi:hypothetical protein